MRVSCRTWTASPTPLSILAAIVVISASSFIGRSVLKFRVPLDFYASRYRAVKIDPGYMQDLSSVARSCTYVRSRVSDGNTRVNQFGTTKVYESWNLMKSSCLVYTGLSVVRFLPSRSRPSFSLRSLPSVLSTLAILIHQRDCATSVITLGLYRETWRTLGGRNVIPYAIIPLCLLTCNAQLISNFFLINKRFSILAKIRILE